MAFSRLTLVNVITEEVEELTELSTEGIRRDDHFTELNNRSNRLMSVNVHVPMTLVINNRQEVRSEERNSERISGVLVLLHFLRLFVPSKFISYF